MNLYRFKMTGSNQNLEEASTNNFASRRSIGLYTLEDMARIYAPKLQSSRSRDKVKNQTSTNGGVPQGQESRHQILVREYQLVKQRYQNKYATYQANKGPKKDGSGNRG